MLPAIDGDDVKLVLIGSVSENSVVVSSSSLSNGYSDDDPVTPTYSDESSSSSSLLVGSNVVSMTFSVAAMSSGDISFVVLSDNVVSVNGGEDDMVLVSNVVSGMSSVVVLSASSGAKLCNRIHESPETFD